MLRGREVSGDELLTVGERIVSLERLFNTRLGLSRVDDRLPTRFTSEPLEIYTFATDGASGEVSRSTESVHSGVVRDLEAMLDRYYHLPRWGGNGVPTRETLHRLELGRWT